MSEGAESASKKNEKPKVQKKSRFQELKAEFKKIIWPTRNEVARQTVDVVLVSIALGILIKVLDIIMSYGVDLLISL